MKERLLSNLNWLLADKILRIAGGIFIGVWIARYLGPADFGLLSFVISFSSLFGVIGKINIEQVVVRDLTKFPESTGAILGSVFRIKLWSSLLAASLAVLAASLLQPNNPAFIAMVSVIVIGFVFNPVDAVDIFYQSKILSKYVVLLRSMSFIIFCAVKVLLIYFDASVIWFSLIITFEMAFGSLLIAWFFHKREKGFTVWEWSSKHAKALIRDGWPLIASSLLIIIHTRIDQVMIGQMLNETQVGLYSAAIRISEAWLFVPGFVVQTSMPYFVSLKENSPVHYHQRLMQLYSVMFWIGTIVGFVTIAFGKPVIILLFGQNYAGAYSALLLIIWTGVFNAQAVARGIWMISENYQLFRLFNNLISVPINITLNIYLIPRFGITGAATASLISVAVGTWFVPFIFRPLRKSNIDLLFSIDPRNIFLKTSKYNYEQYTG